MDELDQEVRRLTGGRDLNAADRASIEAVAGLHLRIQQAREVIDQDGITIRDQNGVLKEHPAVAVERRASAELRGWAKDRPDLFGETKTTTAPGRRKFDGLKAVN